MKNIRSDIKKEEIQKQIKIALDNYKKSISNYSVDKLKSQFNVKDNLIIENMNKTNNQILQKNNFNIRNTTVRTHASDESLSFDKFMNSLDEFMKGDKNIYMAFGGVGDLLLLLGVCYDNEKANVIFMANQESNSFAKRFLDFFNLKHVIYKNLMGTKFCSLLYKKVTSHPNFTISAHLADKCDYGDWKKSTDKYKNRLAMTTDWVKLIGIKKREKKYVIICPSGSHKSELRRRYLTQDEYKKIVHGYLQKGYEVITASSRNDMKTFGLYPHKNCYWLTDSQLINHREIAQDIDFKTFLQIIVSCDDIVSTDTWIKTFMALCGKPCNVIKTRYNSKYQDVGLECCDYIFLNKDFWPKLKIHTYENFIDYLHHMPEA